MIAKIIDGKSLANIVLSNIGIQAHALNFSLHIAAVCIGDNQSLEKFLRIKQKAAQSVGVQFSSYFFKEDQLQEAKNTLKFLANDNTVYGIFVELPLPQSWEVENFLSLIPLGKDVDLISPAGENSFYNNNSKIMPPSVTALRYIIDEQGIDLKNQKVVVVGGGKLVGKPIAHWMRNQGAEVGVVDINTDHPQDISTKADIIIAGAGRANLIDSSWVKDNAMVIDYGFNFDSRGNIIGDVAFEEVAKKAKLITPVPGGMGPLVVAAVFDNLLTLTIG